MNRPLVLCIFGTRPEAIKMAPVIRALQEFPEKISVKVCVTAQHREMLDQVLQLFDIKPDLDLDIMLAGQDLYSLTANLITRLQPVIAKEKPALILVHGDTTTTMIASLAAYYGKIPLGHVESGLRTGDKFHPFPEEINRRVTDIIADLHFAPTEKAKQNLLQEGTDPSRVFVTGNTVIDALYQVRSTIQDNEELRTNLTEKFSWLEKGRRLVVITGHRRENFGRGMQEICYALAELVAKWPDVDFVYPVHLNPNVQAPVNEILRAETVANLFLIDPVDYLSFVYLLLRCDLVLTDSGGIQEEAPSLGKPVVVMREKTERPEAVEAGTVCLAGSSREKIVQHVSKLLSDKEYYTVMSQALNPYGDGLAAGRIAREVLDFVALNQNGQTA